MLVFSWTSRAYSVFMDQVKYAVGWFVSRDSQAIVYIIKQWNYQQPAVSKLPTRSCLEITNTQPSRNYQHPAVSKLVTHSCPVHTQINNMSWMMWCVCGVCRITIKDVSCVFVGLQVRCPLCSKAFEPNCNLHRRVEGVHLKVRHRFVLCGKSYR